MVRRFISASNYRSVPGFGNTIGLFKQKLFGALKEKQGSKPVQNMV
jgi:hypothetical protein